VWKTKEDRRGEGKAIQRYGLNGMSALGAMDAALKLKIDSFVAQDGEPGLNYPGDAAKLANRGLMQVGNR
jgi:hypothetical protein